MKIGTGHAFSFFHHSMCEDTRVEIGSGKIFNPFCTWNRLKFKSHISSPPFHPPTPSPPGAGRTVPEAGSAQRVGHPGGGGAWHTTDTQAQAACRLSSSVQSSLSSPGLTRTWSSSRLTWGCCICASVFSPSFRTG